jgi:hypothetical protein
METLITEIEKWSEKYDFSFQFWGEDNNNVFISKDHVDLHSTGGYETIEEVLKVTLEWVYRVNRTPKNQRII